MARETNVIDYRVSSVQDVNSGISRRTQTNYIECSLLSVDLPETATIHS